MEKESSTLVNYLEELQNSSQKEIFDGIKSKSRIDFIPLFLAIDHYQAVGNRLELEASKVLKSLILEGFFWKDVQKENNKNSKDKDINLKLIVNFLKKIESLKKAQKQKIRETCKIT